MNTCLLSMLLLTIGSAFLAGLAIYFKRQGEVDALNVRIKKMRTTLEKLDVEHRNSIAYYEGMREEITNYATERNTVEKEIEGLEQQIAELTADKEALLNPGAIEPSAELTAADSTKLLITPTKVGSEGIEIIHSGSNKKKKHKRKKSREKEVEILSEENKALEKEIIELKDYKTKVEALEAKMDSISKKITQESPSAATPIVIATPVKTTPAPNPTPVKPSPKAATPIVKTTKVQTKKATTTPIIKSTPTASVTTPTVIKKATPDVAKPAVTKITQTKPSAKGITKKTTSKFVNQDSKSILKRINRRRKEVDFEKIGFSAMGRKDDLQKIRGVEPFIEKKLNALGIYRFAQLSNFDEKTAKQIAKLIEMENSEAAILSWSAIAKTLK